VSDLFLGMIAVAVLVMAIIQVGALVVALRTARRVGETVSRLEQEVKPIVDNLHTMSSDAARATTLAVTQVERAGQLIADVSRRVDETAATLQSSIVTPAREGYAMLQGLMAALSALRQGGAAPADSRSRRQPPAEEEDPLFIG
jgi:hypothetical protein